MYRGRQTRQSVASVTNEPLFWWTCEQMSQAETDDKTATSQPPQPTERTDTQTHTITSTGQHSTALTRGCTDSIKERFDL